MSKIEMKPQRPAATAAILVGCLIAVVFFQIILHDFHPPSQGTHTSSGVVTDKPNTWGFGDPIVLVGDSLTEQAFLVDGWGYGLRLQAEYRRRYDVLNRGTGGISSEQILPHFGGILKSVVQNGQSPIVLTLLLGTNDLYQQISVQRYAQNMKGMVHAVQQIHPSTKIILITPPPQSNEQRTAEMRPYRDAILQLARDARVTVFDTWITFLGPSGKYDRSVERFFTDGIHFNRLGNDAMFNDIKKFLP